MSSMTNLRFPDLMETACSQHRNFCTGWPDLFPHSPSLSMRPKNLSWPTKLASLLLYKWFCCTTLRARNPALLSLLRHRKPAILHHEFTFCIFAFCFCLLSIANELKPNSNRNCILYIKVWLCYWFFNLSIAGGETSKKHSKKLTLSPECDVFWKSGSRAMSTFSRTQCDE